MNIVAVAPSAASSLPMELAVKLTNLKVRPHLIRPTESFGLRSYDLCSWV